MLDFICSSVWFASCPRVDLAHTSAARRELSALVCVIELISWLEADVSSSELAWRDAPTDNALTCLEICFDACDTSVAHTFTSPVSPRRAAVPLRRVIEVPHARRGDPSTTSAIMMTFVVAFSALAARGHALEILALHLDHPFRRRWNLL